MDDDAPGPAQPTSDVLPSGVRRRRSRADALLPAVLAGELLAGVLFGMAWELASTPPGLVAPPPSAVASTSDTLVSVPAPVVAPVTPPAPRRTEPRNPFAPQLG